MFKESMINIYILLVVSFVCYDGDEVYKRRLEFCEDWY